jgi:hypothetical protein
MQFIQQLQLGTTDKCPLPRALWGNAQLLHAGVNGTTSQRIAGGQLAYREYVNVSTAHGYPLDNPQDIYPVSLMNCLLESPEDKT